jgi:histidinol-phosphate phosphatase family protein
VAVSRTGRRHGGEPAGIVGGPTEHARPGIPTVLADKDGTLIEDLPYNVDPGRIRLAPSVADGLRRLGAEGIQVAIVTNQSGVARGYYGVGDLEEVARHLADQFAAAGGVLAGFYACPHLPGAQGPYGIACACRKPLVGLIRRAAADLDLDLPGTWMVGDTWMDVAAGRAAGCRTILVGPEVRYAHTLAPGREPERAVRDFGQAVSVILGAAMGEPRDRAEAHPPTLAAPGRQGERTRILAGDGR